MNLTNTQKTIVETDKSKVLVTSSAAAGKALENSTLIYGPDGPFPIGEAKVGQQIYGEDGELHTIIGVYPQGKKKKYIVNFSDGTSVNCCNEHLWTFQTESLRSKKSKTWRTRSLQEIIDNYPLYIASRAKNNFGTGETCRKNIFIPMTQPINFPKRELPLDPYTLGALLGDGKLGSAGIQTSFSNEDKDVLEFVSTGLKQIGYELHYQSGYDYNIRQINREYGYHQKGKLTLILEELKLDGTRSGNKFIPSIYKYSSIEDRLELLKGIIDTDGYCDGNSYDLILKSKQLVLDVQEICESLGLTAVFQTKKAICTNSPEGRKDCGIVYRLRIKPSKIFPKLHKSQKREKQWKPTNRYSFRAITEIIETDEEIEMTCIQVDNPTSLFVTEHFIVTHNTTCLSERIRYLLDSGVEPSEIVAITFTNNAASEILERLGNPTGIFISTIHSYCNYLLRGGAIDTTKILNEERFDDLFEEIKQNPSCLKHVAHLISDESQDVSKQQFEFYEMINPDNYMYFFDIKQTLYKWRDADPDYLINLSHSPEVTVYSMHENFRNLPDILRFAKKFLYRLGPDYEDDSIAMRSPTDGYNYHVLEGSYTPEQAVESLLMNNDRLKTDWKDWFVLCRTNADIELFKILFEKKNIPVDTFKQADLSTSQIKDKMNENTIKILTVHSAKGLAAPCVLSYNIRAYNDDEARLCYVAATRARDFLMWIKTPPKKKKKKTTITNWE